MTVDAGTLSAWEEAKLERRPNVNGSESDSARAAEDEAEAVESGRSSGERGGALALSALSAGGSCSMRDTKECSDTSTSGGAPFSRK